MSDEQPETVPVLRREALLPTERHRGLGTVAVVCTMAGVASGLALATTLMAMQVADSMTLRSCPYDRDRFSGHITSVDVRPERGFLGVEYSFRDGAAQINRVLRGTPAERISLRRGDRVISVDGDRVDSMEELEQRISATAPGAQPTMVIEREGELRLVRPTLAARPVILY
jgi:S1-C subfamily serine protease